MLSKAIRDRLLFMEWATIGGMIVKINVSLRNAEREVISCDDTGIISRVMGSCKKES